MDLATNTVYEVKNLTEPGVTEQLRDMAAWSQANGWNFVLYLRNGANVSPSLTKWASQNNVQISYFTWP